MTDSKASVVLVDDEEMVITSLRALLQLETEHDIHGFTDPAEAAKFLEATRWMYAFPIT